MHLRGSAKRYWTCMDRKLVGTITAMLSLLFTLPPPCWSRRGKVLVAGIVVGKIADEHLVPTLETTGYSC